MEPLTKRNKSAGEVKKGLLALVAAFVLLIPSVINFMESLDFSRSAIKGEARIKEYVPEIMGKAGGRREIKDNYLIHYQGIEKKVQLGSRMVTSKEKVTLPEKDAPFKAGDFLPIIYIPKNPQKMMINHEKDLLVAAYHSHNSIAFLYLLKLISFLFLFMSIRLFTQSSSRQ
ncbi:MAG: hypothetical protein OEV42_02295 [Deltaproteobacteria bacterium]|nr:hypothetical protein [Deltaproteobacteria bacterium]